MRPLACLTSSTFQTNMIEMSTENCDYLSRPNRPVVFSMSPGSSYASGFSSVPWKLYFDCVLYSHVSFVCSFFRRNSSSLFWMSTYTSTICPSKIATPRMIKVRITDMLVIQLILSFYYTCSISCPYLNICCKTYTTAEILFVCVS